MSQITNLGQYLFYFKYLWGPADFTQLQVWLQNLVYSITQGAFGAAVLQGMDVTPGGGLSVEVAAGVGVGDEAQVCANPSSASVSFSAPSALPRWDLLVARPTVTNTDFIPDPNNPSNNVPLQQTIGMIFVDITGTESATPAYPAKQDGDVIICGIQLVPAQSVIAQSNIDYGPRSLIRKRSHGVIKVSANYVAQLVDETIEADATSGALVVLLPNPETCIGQDFVLNKIDGSSNQVAASGATFDGQPSLVLDTQYQSVTLRSVGTDYRVL